MSCFISLADLIKLVSRSCVNSSSSGRISETNLLKASVAVSGDSISSCWIRSSAASRIGSDKLPADASSSFCLARSAKRLKSSEFHRLAARSKLWIIDCPRAFNIVLISAGDWSVRFSAVGTAASSSAVIDAVGRVATALWDVYTSG